MLGDQIPSLRRAYWSAENAPWLAPNRLPILAPRWEARGRVYGARGGRLGSCVSDGRADCSGGSRDANGTARPGAAGSAPGITDLCARLSESGCRGR